MRRPLLVAIAGVLLALGLCAGVDSQTGPPGSSGVPASSLPPYARFDNERRIEGRIRAIDRPYRVTLHDFSGYVDSVQLHRGTVINPTGTQLRVGMLVTIYGHLNDGEFLVDEVDTEYGPQAEDAHSGQCIYGLRSLDVTHHVNVTFVNARLAPVEVYWISFEGKALLYKTLSSGQRYTQHTFTGHVWMVMAANGKCLSSMIAGQRDEEYLVR